GIEMEPDSSTSLLAAVERLTDDEPLRHQMQAAGREVVAEKYTRDHLAGEYLELLHRVVGIELEPSPEQPKDVVSRTR
ncbi:MAG: hypothetical protein ABGZ17_16610, partial [Planctomycetaceae bacterium]